MINFLQDQSLFETRAEVITNTVNCVGVMGKGIALEYKSRYPDMFFDYKERCSKNEVKPGVPYIWEDEDTLILNFPSKNHWRDGSRLEWLESGFRWIVENYRLLGFTSIAMPPVGCGNGGLNWSDVKNLMLKYFSDLDDLLVTVYLPKEASDQKTPSDIGKISSKRNEKRIVAKPLFEEL